MPKCKSCGADIRWIETNYKKMMPVNSKIEAFVVIKPDVYGGEYGVVERGYIPHFATCPHADQHRKRKE